MHRTANVFRLPLLALASAIIFLASATTTLAAPGDVIINGSGGQGGLGKTGAAAGYQLRGSAPKVAFAPALLTYANGLVGLMGLLFMVQIIYSGYLWMTAQGNEEQVAKAKARILNSVIALAIIIAARIIVELVIDIIGTIALS